MNFGGQSRAVEFHQLRYFVAAAEALNISRAAQKLHVSQPAMSRQIRLLEDELGAALFERVRQRIRLTPAGAFFHTRARQLLWDAEAAGRELRERFAGAGRLVRLGFITPFLDDLVVPALREFRAADQRTQFSLFDLPPSALLQQLREGELDAALLGNIAPEHRKEFDVRAVSRHPMAAVVPSGHPLARRKTIKLAALGRDPWISLAESAFPGRRQLLAEAGRRAGFVPRVASEVESLPILLATIAAGEGVGILPSHAAKLPHAGCVFIALAPPAPSATLFIVLARGPAAPEVAALLHILAAHGRRLGKS
jgi:DNA-binding transcriptional LysR family regulator